VRKNSKNPEIKIIVVSRQVHKLNIQNTIRAGANDFLADPFDNENLYHRILYHLTPKHELEPSGWESSVADSKNWEYIKLMLESTESLSRTERDHEHETFLKTLQEIARLTGSNRTSLIIVDAEAESGLVLATSDDPAFQNFPLALAKYPEIIHVVHSGHFVLVDDVAQSSLTHQINANVKSIKIGSIMVFPIRYQNEVMGVLVVRRRTANDLPSMDIIRILQSVATTMAAHANLRVRLRKIYKDFSQKAG
jgi:transcriptional regulator with GAF, ATPase, and Fis domain